MCRLGISHVANFIIRPSFPPLQAREGRETEKVEGDVKDISQVLPATVSEDSLDDPEGHSEADVVLPGDGDNKHYIVTEDSVKHNSVKAKVPDISPSTATGVTPSDMNDVVKEQSVVDADKGTGDLLSTMDPVLNNNHKTDAVPPLSENTERGDGSAVRSSGGSSPGSNVVIGKIDYDKENLLRELRNLLAADGWSDFSRRHSKQPLLLMDAKTPDPNAVKNARRLANLSSPHISNSSVGQRAPHEISAPSLSEPDGQPLSLTLRPEEKSVAAHENVMLSIADAEPVHHAVNNEFIDGNKADDDDDDVIYFPFLASSATSREEHRTRAGDDDADDNNVFELEPHTEISNTDNDVVAFQTGSRTKESSSSSSSSSGLNDLSESGIFSQFIRQYLASFKIENIRKNDFFNYFKSEAFGDDLLKFIRAAKSPIIYLPTTSTERVKGLRIKSREITPEDSLEVRVLFIFSLFFHSTMTKIRYSV
jgi:hypothetical protein